jgi:hypothetical protein
MVIVICGEKTHTATGVDVELRITQEEKKALLLARWLWQQNLHTTTVSQGFRQALQLDVGEPQELGEW